MKKVLVATSLLFCVFSIANAINWQDKSVPTFKGQGLQTFQVSITSSSATALPAANENCVDNIIYNDSATYDLYIGSSGVATTHGYPIKPKQSMSLQGLFSGPIYAIWQAAGSTATVYILQLMGN